MPSITRTHVRSLASGLGQATGFDSPVGVPVLYLFAAALDVRGRVSNPCAISLPPCYPCPDGLAVGGLATSPAPPLSAHDPLLTHHAY